ncbi:MAG: hypothetical protein AAB360_00310 [Patescibacteria group bacterium]
MSDTLYLEPDDEITAVIDRLKLSSAGAVTLVIPRGGTLAQSIINLKILKRSAVEMGKSIALVANDRIVRNLSSQLGIPVFDNVNDAARAEPALATRSVSSLRPEEGSASGLRVKSYAKYGGESADEVPAAGTAPAFPLTSSGEEESRSEDRQVGLVSPSSRAVSRRSAAVLTHSNLGERRSMPGRRGSRKIFFVLAILIIISGAVFSALLLPYARASIVLKTEDYAREFTVAVDRSATAVSVGTLSLPGQLFEIEREKTKRFDASGAKNVGEKARGKMTVLNSYDSSAHQYKQGARFTSQGKTFLAESDFSVMGATITLVGGKVDVKPGEGTVNVVSENAGADYNLESTNYVLAGAPAQIYGRGDKMAGGVTREVKVVTEEDLTRAEEETEKEILPEAQAEIKERAAKDNYLLIEGGLVSELVSTSHSKQANDESDSFETTMKQKLFGVGFRESDLRELLSGAMQEQLGSDKMLVNPEKSEIGFEVLENNRDLGVLKIKTKFAGRVGKKLSEKEIGAKIRNQSADAAKAVLAGENDIESAELSVWPPKLNRTPFLLNRIDVVFDYSK